MSKSRNHEILKSVGCLGSQQLVKLKVSKIEEVKVNSKKRKQCFRSCNSCKWCTSDKGSRKAINMEHFV